MTAIISKFIFRTLCDHRGSLDFQRLEETIAQRFTVEESLLRSVISDQQKFIVQEGSKAVLGKILSPDSLLVAKTSLRVCQSKPGECRQCDGLHLCKYLVAGHCAFGLKCRNPHTLDSPYNAQLLVTNGLNDLTEKQVFQLLLQNDPYVLPEICPHYNKGNGLHGSCRFTTSCTKLHVCLHYLQGDCKFGSACKRAHSVGVHGNTLLKALSRENLDVINEIYRNKLIIVEQEERRGFAVAVPGERIPAQQPAHSHPGSPTSSAGPSKPPSDIDRNEICLYSFQKRCSFNVCGRLVSSCKDLGLMSHLHKDEFARERCARVHWHLPYKWQVLDKNGVTWKDLENMEDIEKAFCDPKHDTHCIDPVPATGQFHGLVPYLRSLSLGESVNFLKMTFGTSPVRRLSTASSVSKPPHYALTTEWLWYWKDDNGKWHEFGQSDGHPTASATSETLENVYLADREAEIPFVAGKHQYILRLRGAAGSQQMYQENVEYQTKREIRRRPRFVSAQDIEGKLNSASSSTAAESFPSHWDRSAIPEFGYRLVALSKSAKEYGRVEMLFKKTMPNSNINSLNRIQNPFLWKAFQWQKEQMKQRNGGKAVNEQYLFHGTDKTLVEEICEKNFDWRLCGVHGTAYGRGSYFARDASYAHKYARPKSSREKVMFVTLVLVGEYTKGASSYVLPPPKANSKSQYDSCVDSERDPSIYVIFKEQQLYPEYVISYS